MANHDDFFSSGGKSLSFKGEPEKANPRFQSWKGGKIVEEIDERQATDMDTGELKFWPDGKPVMQLILVLQTKERDEEEEDDDGIRTLYLEKGSRRAKAVGAAIKKAGAPGPRKGGEVYIMWTGSEKPKKAGHNGLKNWEARYKAPEHSADDLNGDDPFGDAETSEKPTKPTAGANSADDPFADSPPPTEPPAADDDPFADSPPPAPVETVDPNVVGVLKHIAAATTEDRLKELVAAWKTKGFGPIPPKVGEAVKAKVAAIRAAGAVDEDDPFA